VIVPAGLTLTVRPGVIVQANSSARLQVAGYLDASGTTAEPITFTSATDSGPGQWAGFYVNSGELNLQHATVRYAGQYNGWGRAAVNVAYGAANIDSSRIFSSANVGNADYGVHLCCGGARATISGTLFAGLGDSTADIGILTASNSDPITVVNSTFENIAGYPIQATIESLPRLTGNTFSGNAFDRILAAGGQIADGAHLIAQTGLQGYEFTSQLNVPAGRTLYIDPGVTVMARSGVDVRVTGHLAAPGTAAQPITFTSSADSAPQQWGSLYMQEGSADLRYVTVRYGGQFIGGNLVAGALFLQSTGGTQKYVTLDHVTVRDNAYVPVRSEFALSINGSHVTMTDTAIINNGEAATDYGLYLHAGVLTATRSAIQSNAGTGLYVGNGRATLTCSTVSTNGYDGVRVLGSALFSALGSGFYGNAGAGITNTSSVATTAAYNWWGDASGPGGVGPGSGDEVSAKVVFDPWLPREECVSDLALTRSAVAATVIAGTQLSYTLNVTNTGPGDATGVIVSDTLPVGQSFIIGTVSQGSGCSGANGVVSCEVGALPIGSSAAATITVAIDPTARGQLLNTARAGGAQTDHAPTNNTAEAAIVAQAEVDLAIVKATSADPLIFHPITYTLTISATGPSAGLNVVVTDTLPVGLSASSSDCVVTDNVAVCAPGNIAPGGVLYATLIVTPTTAGELLNHAEVRGADIEADVSNNVFDLTVNVRGYRRYLPLVQK
jgi:uncharacterized repeat protein (TIGR01451 family)